MKGQIYNLKLLLHVCCGPCAVFPVSELQKENIDFSGLFYNPNIHPLHEYERRRENAFKLSGIKGFTLASEYGFEEDKWLDFNGTPNKRCEMCYDIRMDYIAKYAMEKGFDAFTTTLLVSPYQKHELLVESCRKASEKYGIDFYYRDFRTGFRSGQQEARELGLYRQKYCGCIMSLLEK